MIGKQEGVLKFWIPKYFWARGLSKEPYLAFAGNVNGGLFPLIWCQRLLGANSCSILTASHIEASEKDWMEPVECKSMIVVLDVIDLH